MTAPGTTLLGVVVFLGHLLKQQSPTPRGVRLFEMIAPFVMAGVLFRQLGEAGGFVPPASPNPNDQIT